MPKSSPAGMLLGPEDPSACLPLLIAAPVQALSEHGARSYDRDGLGPMASISGSTDDRVLGRRAVGWLRPQRDALLV
jgi:hypothetical protein